MRSGERTRGVFFFEKNIMMFSIFHSLSLTWKSWKFLFFCAHCQTPNVILQRKEKLN